MNNSLYSEKVFYYPNGKYVCKFVPNDSSYSQLLSKGGLSTEGQANKKKSTQSSISSLFNQGPTVYKTTSSDIGSFYRQY